jgi:ketosteroid isomerase-like protein
VVFANPQTTAGARTTVALLITHGCEGTPTNFIERPARGRTRERSFQAKQKDTNMKTLVSLSALALSLTAIPMLTSASAHGAHTKTLSAPATAAPAVPEITVDTAFRAALASGNAILAASYLSDDVLIFESGHIERSKAEYQSHHLNADIAFASATQYRVLSRAVKVVGDTAWTTTEGQTTGDWRGRPINSIGTETMVMRRTAGQWRIVHIHWSSRNVTPAAPQ